MSGWRPEGLVNPHQDEFRNGKPYGRASDWEDTVDEVVEALRCSDNGIHRVADDELEVCAEQGGWWVFIPDEEK